MRTILTVVGARPQFIKAATVSRVIAASAGSKELLLHTGQHYDENMSQVFFDELGLRAPDYRLGIGSGNHGEQTGKMLAAIEGVLLDVRPDWVLVYGDTNSTLAGALAAVKQHIPVAHVEAGLRSDNRRMPEEINRILVDHASDLLLAPTSSAVERLSQEGIPPHRVHLVGDCMYDAALHYAAQIGDGAAALARLGLKSGDYILATIHRAENSDDPVRMQAIVAGLAQVAKQIPVVLPMHPRTRGNLDRFGLLAETQQSLKVIEPVGYLDMLSLEKNARLVITDSGGVQKEAYFCGVPCLTVRDETEWRELVECGANRLVTPLTEQSLTSAVAQALAGPARLAREQTLFGGGHAAEAIVESIQDNTSVMDQEENHG